ncbi:MAG: hypothetical protein H7250_03640 [Flavobacterium sp.]|nr:hypothetical protein [Flavobacterium sp.]
MKKLLLCLCLLLLNAQNILSQTKVIEPDFVGEALLLKTDNSIAKLDKSISQMKIKSPVTVFSKIKIRFEIDECCASTRIPLNNSIKIIVKAVDNKTDPMSIVSIFKFEKRKKDRRAEMLSLGMFSGSANNQEYIKFKAEKYGESSYLLLLDIKEKGEYGITVKNPNSMTESSGMVISSFGVD